MSERFFFLSWSTPILCIAFLCINALLKYREYSVSQLLVIHCVGVLRACLRLASLGRCGFSRMGRWY